MPLADPLPVTVPLPGPRIVPLLLLVRPLLLASIEPRLAPLSSSCLLFSQPAPAAANAAATTATEPSLLTISEPFRLR